MSYDASGRRIMKVIDKTGIDDFTYHSYQSGNSIIEERNYSNIPIKDHVWGLTYVDEAVQSRINTVPSDSNPAHWSWTSYWHVQDANFNEIALVSSTAAVQERYQYSAYGQRQVFTTLSSSDATGYSPIFQSKRVVTSGSVTQPYGLNEIGHQGLLHDEQTGLVYNRARQLNPMLGRFMQEEPFGAAYVDKVNLYIVARANPLYFGDPSGLWAILGPITITGSLEGTGGLGGGSLILGAGGIMIVAGFAFDLWIEGEFDAPAPPVDFQGPRPTDPTDPRLRPRPEPEPRPRPKPRQPPNPPGKPPEDPCNTCKKLNDARKTSGQLPYILYEDLHHPDSNTVLQGTSYGVAVTWARLPQGGGLVGGRDYGKQPATSGPISVTSGYEPG
jgi:RHS repeat-associated protein